MRVPRDVPFFRALFVMSVAMAIGLVLGYDHGRNTSTGLELVKAVRAREDACIERVLDQAAQLRACTCVNR